MRALWSVIHNMVAHPAMVFLPEKYGTWFHDWTAEKAYGLPEERADALET